MNDIKAILFDFGGTIDTNGIHWSEMIWIAYEKNNVCIKKTAYEKAYIYAERSLNTGKIKSNTTFHEMLIEKISLQFNFLHIEKYLTNEYSDNIIKKITDTCYNEVKSNIKNQIEVLSYLKSKYSLALVSNFYGNLKTVINEFELTDYFSVIIDSHDIGIRKPDPLIWEAGLKLLDMPYEQTVVVGDSYINDIAPAKYLGCKAIWLKGRSWHNQNQFEHYSADKIINNLNELKTIL